MDKKPQAESDSQVKMKKSMQSITYITKPNKKCIRRKKVNSELEGKQEKINEIEKINELKSKLETESENNRKLEKKMNELEIKVKILMEERKKMKGQLEKNEEDKIQLLEEIEKVNKITTKSLDRCVDYIRSQNKEAEKGIIGMMVSFLDCVRKEKEEACLKLGCRIDTKNVYLHELNREITFKVTKGMKWHPEICIYYLIKRYMGDDIIYNVFKVANIRGCVWIQIDDERDAWEFSKQLSCINVDRIIEVREVPKQLSDLIIQMQSEDRWCWHKAEF